MINDRVIAKPYRRYFSERYENQTQLWQTVLVACLTVDASCPTTPNGPEGPTVSNIISVIHFLRDPPLPAQCDETCSDAEQTHLCYNFCLIETISTTITVYPGFYASYILM